jgi:hypothetical protein
MAVAAVGFAAGAAKADTVYDLTTLGKTVDVNGAHLVQVNPQTTRTGVFQPFLRIQANGFEQGYNTDDSKPNNLQFNQKGGPWTHSLFQAQLVPVTKDFGGGSQSYYLFSVDLNQTGSNPLISMTQFKLFLGASPFPNNYDGTTFGLDSLGNPTNAVLKYDIDSGGDVTVQMNAGLNSGSGSGDVDVYVPVWAADPNRPFVYLFSAFGADSGSPGAVYPSNDGFEEWATILNPNAPPPITNPVPAPPALVLGLVGAAGLLGKRAWARKRTPELA